MTELIKVIAFLVQDYLQLPEGRGVIYNQKWLIPQDDGLFFAVQYIGEKRFGTKRVYIDDPTNPGGLIEVQGSQTQEMYQIDLFSKDSSAREREHEVVFALNSTLSQQLQEQYSFQIGPLPSAMNDVSQVEGAARLNRYAITFKCLRAYRSERLVPAYTDFQIPPKSLLTNP